MTGIGMAKDLSQSQRATTKTGGRGLHQWVTYSKYVDSVEAKFSGKQTFKKRGKRP